MASDRQQSTARTKLRDALKTPHLACLVPAVMILAYWAGGERAMLVLALVFPTIFALASLAARRHDGGHDAADDVTGLPLRTQLIRKLDRGFASEAEYEKTCFVLEVDDAAQLIKKYGVSEWEAALGELADRFRGILRNNDLVCVIGEGRFGVSVDKNRRMDLEATLQLAARLQAVAREPIVLKDSAAVLSVCVGFSMPSRAAEATGDSLLSAAESALHSAQHAGPGSIRAYSNGMAPRIARCDHSQDELRVALDQGDIRAWFQPQIDTQTGELTGFEALARWCHALHGLIAPGAFLPAVAKSGLMGRLNDVILTDALTALRGWDDAGCYVPQVAINVSEEQLSDPNLVDRIAWEIDRFDLSPDRLSIEILENTIAQSVDDIAARNITALSDLGCHIDLDDFGTGHASITSIQRFDVDRIKIDRSFVTRIDSDPSQRKVIKAILNMSEQLGLSVIAEGIETHGELAMLSELGCKEAQGYAIGRPMPFDDTLDWIRTPQSREYPVPLTTKRA